MEGVFLFPIINSSISVQIYLFRFKLVFVGPIEFAQSLEDVLVEAREWHLPSKEAKQTLLANLLPLVTASPYLLQMD